MDYWWLNSVTVKDALNACPQPRIDYTLDILVGKQWFTTYILHLASYHTNYTVGGKCIYHQHIMDAGSTLREFGALK